MRSPSGHSATRSREHAPGAILVMFSSPTAPRLGRAQDEDESRRRSIISRLGTLARGLPHGVTVVVNPFTNLALGDRKGTGPPFSEEALPAEGPRTPVWRGLTAVQELRAAGVPLAFASDCVRDWWCAYGDFDLLEVAGLAIKLAHLDTADPGPVMSTGAQDEAQAISRRSGTGQVADWLCAISRWPRMALRLQCSDGPGGALTDESTGLLDAVALDARSISELFARPQADRIVIAAGDLLVDPLPSYEDLDDLVSLTHQGHAGRSIT